MIMLELNFMICGAFICLKIIHDYFKLCKPGDIKVY